MRATLLALTTVVSLFQAACAGHENGSQTYRTGKITLKPFHEQFVRIDSFPLDSAANRSVLRFSGFAVDKTNGTFWIADASESRVVHFDRDGNSLTVLGNRGEGPGEFTEPRFLTRVGDSLLVGEANGRVSVFLRDSPVRTFSLDSISFLSSLAAVSESTLVGTSLPGSRGALLEWNTSGKLLHRALYHDTPPAPSKPDSPFWGTALQYWVVADHRSSPTGIFAVATISDSIWTGSADLSGLTASVLKPVGYKPTEVPSGLHGPKELADWMHKFDVAVAPFSSSRFTGYSFSRGVLYYGDPNVLMLSEQPGKWVALSGGPPILGANGDTLYALLDAGGISGRMSIGRFVPRTE